MAATRLLMRRLRELLRLKYDAGLSHRAIAQACALAQAADILDMPLLDHLIVGDNGRYFSFREAGTLTARLADGVRE